LIDFEVQRCTRRCHKTDREFKPGEEFYSALIADGAETVRRDYALDAWVGPPEGALACWKSRMPDPKASQMQWAPNDVMLHYFEQLAEQPEKADVRYVLALLLVRRRVLRLDETVTDETGENLVLYCPKKETEQKVPVREPGTARIEAIQNELAELLFGDG